MTKFILYLIFINIFLSVYVCSVSADAPNIDAPSYILIDQKTGQVLCEKKPDLKLYPASTTKIMTAIIALENSSLDKKMTANMEDIKAIGPGGMNIGIMPDEEIMLEDLLNALLVRSANETAYIISRNISSSYRDFATLMNKKAADLGAKDTNFVNPCGMDTETDELTHLSTARDLSTISRYAMNIPKFREIVKKSKYTMPTTNKHNKEVDLYATNKLLLYSKYKSNYYKEITGIKTGYTDRAGHNLVSSAVNKDGMELISVILGVKNQSANKVFDYSKELLEYGFKNYNTKKIVEKDTLFTKLPIENAQNKNETLSLIAENDFSYVTLLNERESGLIRKELFPEKLTAPIKKGAVLGQVEYWKNNVLIGKLNIVASNDVLEKAKPSYIELFLDILKRSIMAVYAFIIMKISVKNILTNRTVKKGFM